MPHVSALDPSRYRVRSTHLQNDDGWGKRLMTPEQRMNFFVLVSKYDYAVAPGESIDALEQLREFVELLEFEAHCAGQDMQIHLHQKYGDCDWKKEDNV